MLPAPVMFPIVIFPPIVAFVILPELDMFDELGMFEELGELLPDWYCCAQTELTPITTANEAIAARIAIDERMSFFIINLFLQINCYKTILKQ